MEEPTQFKCRVCSEIKDKEEFKKDKHGKYGITYICKNCNSFLRKKWKIKNRDKINDNQRKYRKNNPEKEKEYYQKNREKELERGHIYRINNKEKIKEIQSKHKLKDIDSYKKKAIINGNKWRKNNPEKVKQIEKIGYQKNKEKIKKASRLWYQNNINKVRQYYVDNKVRISERVKKHNQLPEVKKAKNLRKRNRKNNDLNYRLRESISNYIYKGLNKIKLSKNGKSVWEKLPYTVDELIKHLESKFIQGMDWDNYGFYGWHIDHKKPHSLFYYTSMEDEEFQKCWSLENLYPLWSKENLSKGKKILTDEEYACLRNNKKIQV